MVEVKDVAWEFDLLLIMLGGVGHTLGLSRRDMMSTVGVQ